MRANINGVEYDYSDEERDLLSIRDRNIAEVEILRQMLRDTDYQAIKYAEGALSDEEYTPMREKRKEWRKRVNEIYES